MADILEGITLIDELISPHRPVGYHPHAIRITVYINFRYRMWHILHNE